MKQPYSQRKETTLKKNVYDQPDAAKAAQNQQNPNDYLERDPSANKPDDNPPLTPEEETHAPVATETAMDRAKAFLKQWWWAVAIVAYIVYKEWKGGGQ